MFPAQMKSNRLQKLASSVLLAMIVFQIGACPCGCLEHNAWVQMLGLGDHHEEFVSLDDRLSIQDAGHHDCTGEGAHDYFNNARTQFGSEPLATQYLVSLTERGISCGQCPSFAHLLCSERSQRLPRGPARTTLQVYLL